MLDIDDENRTGYAGMHDIIHVENINRTMKKEEKVEDIKNIYLDKPLDFKSADFEMLLVQGPHDEREGFALFPLGLGYIARIVHDMGINVAVVDAHAEGLSIDETVASIQSRKFNVLGLTALSTQYNFIKIVAEKIKKTRPDVKIIVGGQLAHYNSHTVIQHTSVDVCVIGEGEITIQEIFYNFNQLERVNGIAFRDKENNYVKNPAQKRIKNLDAVPLPYYDIFNMKYYLNNGFYGARAKRAINVLSSRGCPYSCTFCSLSFPNVTYRSVDNVIEEIRYLIKKFDVDGVSFCDELFIINKKRVMEFCEKIKPLGIKWGGQARANIVKDDVQFLRKMKDAGACYVGFGLESATSEMLSSMQKKTTVEQNIQCVNAAHEAGLVVVAQYMFGFPGESLESIAAGIEYFNAIDYVPPLGPDTPAHISITVPLPGSQLYEDSKAMGLIVDEDEYLSRISIGYMESKAVIVNLTKFSDEELLQLKEYAENKMMANYVARAYNKDKLWRVKRIAYKFFEIAYHEGILTLMYKLSRKIGKLVMGVVSSRISMYQVYISFTRLKKPEDYIYRSNLFRELDKLLSVANKN